VDGEPLCVSRLVANVLGREWRSAHMARQFAFAAEVFLCGPGKVMERVGEQLARQSAAIPVFLKRDANRWEYRGNFAVVGSVASGTQFMEEVSHSNRPASEISRVVLLRRVAD
jgi:hypothetical protein